MVRTATAGPEDSGIRLDIFVAKGFSAPSRSFAARLIDEGRVRVNGRKARASYRVLEGDAVEADFPEAPEKSGIKAEQIELTVVYEDDDIIVLDKPKGLVVHPGAGRSSGTLVNALLGRENSLSSIGGTERPGIVHRLDKDTSGLLVVAKNDRAHVRLSADLQARRMGRKYWAIARGSFHEDSGSIDVPVGRSQSDRRKMAARPDGRAAVTHFKVLERFPGYTLLELKLESGRTHQIRVHLSYIGHPVAGDAQYGGTEGELGLASQALHAVALELNHPADGRRMSFSSNPGAEFADALDSLRNRRGGRRQ
jgi:23S rRNA pseudouridine1911/1915/1917 synthase